MTTGEYRKNYDGDYSKSYKNLAVWKKQNEIRRQEYDVVSKKLNDTSYSRSERQAVFDTGSRPKESERVNSDGSSSRRVIKHYQEPVKRDWVEPKSRYEKSKEESTQPTNAVPPSAPTIEVPLKKKVKEEPISRYQELKDQYAAEATTAKTTPLEKETYQFPTSIPSSPKVKTPVVEPIIEKSKEVKAQSQTIAEEPKRWKNAYEQEPKVVDDGNYNHYDYPIEEVGNGVFKNQKTKKTINTEEAKEVLKMAGYAPKQAFASIGAIVFVFIVSNIIFPTVAPFIGIGYGVYKINTPKTAWQKGAKKYYMPASSSEKMTNTILGILCIVYGIITAYYYYSKLL